MIVVEEKNPATLGHVRGTAPQEAHNMTTTLNDPGAVLGELNNLRKIVVAAIALLRRERAEVREAEFFGAREGAG